MKRYLFNGLLLVLILGLTSCEWEPHCGRWNDIYEIEKTGFKEGDNLNWALKSIDDSNWQENNIDYTKEIYWSRTHINLTDSLKEFEPYGLFVDVFGEYDVYWDGVLIGENGNPGKELLSKPKGNMWATFIIPDSLTAIGPHTIALRTSRILNPDHDRGIWFLIDNYDHLLQFALITTSFMHIFAGTFLMAFLYFFFLFLTERKNYPMLIFSISCLLIFALVILEYIKFYVPIHYSQHYVRLEYIGLLTYCISFLMPLYFSLQFKMPYRNYMLLAYFIVLNAVFFYFRGQYDNTAYYMAICMLIFLIGIITYGIIKKQTGATIVLIALLLCIIIDQAVGYDISIFAGFSLILFSMFYILTLKSKEQRLAYENSLVQSTRLRLALLKKNIQPHFIMNTLASLIDWVEESPEKGVVFIEALADEFHLLNRIEDKTLIPISQEIELCKSHLKVMMFRKELYYKWEDIGINPAFEIPPGIFHTLIENGITHCLPKNDNTIYFILEYTNLEKSHELVLKTIGKVRKPKDKPVDGTGLKYIKARLTESYKDNWELQSFATNEGWINNIKISKK